jgi:hypothetical protein
MKAKRRLHPQMTVVQGAVQKADAKKAQGNRLAIIQIDISDCPGEELDWLIETVSVALKLC